MESDEELLIIQTMSSDNGLDHDDSLDCHQQIRDDKIDHTIQDFPTVFTSPQPTPGPFAEVNQVEVQIELETDVAEQPYLTLPEDKDRHLFVSHSSEDSDKVWPIVEALEKRFNVKCIYADRDFQPGMDIMTNVKESMERSWKVLLMLTPSFTLSGWCKYERDYAFVKSIESRTNGIIPVLLEECELPPTLKTVTYIDGTQSFCDIPAKVIQAMIRPDIAENMMTFDSLKRCKLLLQAVIRRLAWTCPNPKLLQTTYKAGLDYFNSDENGYCVDIVAQRDVLWKYRPAKYKFSLEQHHITTIQEAQIKLPIALIEEALTLLNKTRAVRHYDFSVSRKKLLCWSVFLLPLLGLVIYGGTVYDYGGYQNNGEFTTRSQQATAITSMCVGFVMLVVVPVCLCVIPVVCHRQKIYRDVHKMMWKKMFQRCLEMDTILLFCASREKKPTKYSSDLIADHLWSVTPVMVLDYEKLPDASYNRHNVRLGKACICQCLEQSIGTHIEQMA